MKKSIGLFVMLSVVLLISGCAGPFPAMPENFEIEDFLDSKNFEELVETTAVNAYELGLVDCIARFDLGNETIFCDEPKMPALNDKSVEDLTFKLIQKAKGFDGLPSQAKEYSSQELAHYAKVRAEKMSQLIKEDPQRVIQNSIPDNIKQKFPPLLDDYLEKEVELSGFFEVFYVDNFDELDNGLDGELVGDLETSDNDDQLESVKHENDEHVHEVYELTVGDELIQVYSKSSDLVHLSKSNIVIRGVLLDDKLAVADADSVVSVLDESTREDDFMINEVTSYKKTAVILVNFLDRPNAFLKPVDDIRHDIFTGNLSVNEFVREASFDVFALSGHFNDDGDIYGWYVLPHNVSICTSYRALANAAKAAAAEDGFNPDNYRHIMYLFPPSPCGYAGLGSVGGKETWINTYNVNVMSHELGHNFGFSHAGTYACSDDEGNRVTLSDNCEKEEYGDPYDIMGSVQYSRHFNNLYKQRWWLPEDSVLEVEESGTYTLRSHQYLNEGPQVLKIKRVQESDHNKRFIYVEFREQFGKFDMFHNQDNILQGVLLRLGGNIGNGKKTALLDAYPQVSHFHNSALRVNSVFVDPLTNISIELLERHDDFAVLQILFGDDSVVEPPTCIPSLPDLVVVPNNVSGNPGDAATFTATISNLDSEECEQSSFMLELQVPSGWTKTPNEHVIDIQPGASISLNFEVESALDADAESYALEFSVTRSASNLVQKKYSTFVILEQEVDEPEPECVRVVPELFVSPTDFSGYAGDMGTFSVTVNNLDSNECNSSTFLLEIDAPPRWIEAPSQITLNLGPNSAATRTFNVSAASNADEGNYPISFSAKNMGADNLIQQVYSTFIVLEEETPPPNCFRSAPDLVLRPASSWADSGDSKRYYVAVKNTDSLNCNPSLFETSLIVPQGWGITPIQTRLYSPGKQLINVVDLDIPVDVNTGTYTIESNTRNLDSNLNATSFATINVVQEDTTPPIIDITSPSNGDEVFKDFLVSATITDDTGIAEAHILLNDNHVWSCYNIANNLCQIIVKWDMLIEGENTIRVVAKDSSPQGNEDFAEVSVMRACATSVC
ncbi:MAG: NEW3 domain-containing protein [Candidatus Woesearchaeota archaeon]